MESLEELGLFNSKRKREIFFPICKYLIWSYREDRASLLRSWQMGEEATNLSNHEVGWKLDQVSWGKLWNMLGCTRSPTEPSSEETDLIRSALSRGLDMVTSRGSFQTKLFNDSVMFDFKFDNVSKLHLLRSSERGIQLPKYRYLPAF